MAETLTSSRRAQASVSSKANSKSAQKELASK
jgi:hypothetical protein